ncbi:phage head closure protein [Fictibacillus enclensis]|uniref:phage head closure protein n=1 Tax=Fictibacillus enclensis TaxID=1017270 RepID=UPI0025A08B76|nr:phage head closure protein [Fictibacillus enclensis]MDM5199252.1 phage head closure protein [Fictibacillus enclensis]
MKNPRKYNKKITFFEVTSTKDKFGVPVENETIVATIPAHVKTKTVREYERTIGTVLEGTLQIEVRNSFAKSIKTSMKFEYAGIRYDIKEMLPNDIEQETVFIGVKIS